MIPFRTVGQVFDAIGLVKAGASALVTNFFPEQRKLQTWIDREQLFGICSANAVFFFQRDTDFWHLYFCAASEEALKNNLTTTHDWMQEAVTVDLVGSEAALKGTLTLLESAGFRQYRQLQRMTRSAQSDPVLPAKDLPAVFADADDLPAIRDLIFFSFDRYAEQLPLLDEIGTAVTNRQILVVKKDGLLAGLLFFQTQGFTSTVRFWLVAEPFRAFGIGSALMRHYFATQTSARRFLLWVVATNENAVQKYRHYGFAPDGLIDHVLVNEKIPA